MRQAMLTIIVLSSLACSNSPSQTAKADEYVFDCTAVSGTDPFASDESYVKIIEAEAARRVVADACKSPDLVAPPASSTLSLSTPPAFRFNATHSGCVASVLPASNERYACPPKRTPKAAWLAALKFAVSLIEGTAEAHCGAFTGENYLLRITRASDSTPLYTALLSVTSFTPDPSIWQRSLSGRAGQGASLTIERAVFLRGSINEGPYVQPQSYSFTIGP